MVKGGEGEVLYEEEREGKGVSTGRRTQEEK